MRLTALHGARVGEGYEVRELKVLSAEQLPAAPAGTPTLSAAGDLSGAALHGAMVTLTLAGGAFEAAVPSSRVTVSGLSGVGVRAVTRSSDTQLAVELSYTGQVVAQASLGFEVAAAAVRDHDQPLRASLRIDPVPTVEVASAATFPTGSDFLVRLTFSEPVTGLGFREIEVDNGTASGFTGTGAEYAFTVAPAADFEGSVVVRVPAGAAQSAGGKDNTAGSASFAVDTVAPTVTMSSAATFPASTPFAVALAFSEEVTGLALADVRVANGAAAQLTGGGRDYSVRVVPLNGYEGGLEVELPAGAAEDLRGNASEAASATFAVDTRAPMLARAVANGNALVLTYDEDLDGDSVPVATAYAVEAGPDGDSLSAVAPAAMDPVSVSGRTVTLRLAVAVGVGQTVTVGYTAPASGKVRDRAGNAAADLDDEPAANVTTRPTTAIASRAKFPTKDAFAVTVEFSEPVAGFALADIVVARGAASAFTETKAGTAWSVEVTPEADYEGDVTVSVVKDAARGGNGVGNEAASKTFAVDTKRPAAPTFSPAEGATTTSAKTDVTLTFAEPVSRTAAGDEFATETDLKAVLTLKFDDANGADIAYAASIDSTGQVVTIDPAQDLADGDVYVAVSAGYYDAAGNRGAAANATFAVDTTVSTPKFDPADGATTRSAATDVTLTFAEPIRRTAAGGEFATHAELAGVLTLKSDSAVGADIPYAASIDVAKQVVTIDPTDDLADGDVYVAVSDAYYDAHGNQGAVASAKFAVDTVGPAAPKFDPAGGATTRSADTAVTLTFAEAVRRTVDGDEFTTEAHLKAVLTLKSGSVAGDDIAYEASIDAAKKVVTIDPTENLADGDVYVAVSDGYYDAAGNQGAAAAAKFAVDTERPEVSSIVRRAPPSSPTNANALTWRVAFSEDVANVTDGDFAAEGTTATLTATAVSTSKSLYDVTASGGDLVGLDGTVTLGLSSGQDVADAAGNALDATAAPDPNEDSYTLDNTAPAFESAAATGDTLVLTYDEDLDENSVPAASAYAVEAGPDGDSLSAVALAGTDPVSVSERTVTLKLAAAVGVGQTVTVDYTAPTSDPVRDPAGNAAANLSDQSVTNATTRPTATIASSATFPTKDAFAVTVEFSAAVTGFALADVDVARGAASMFTETETGTAWSVVVTPEATTRAT